MLALAFVRGLEVKAGLAAGDGKVGLATGDGKVGLATGKVKDNLGASDHKPGWVALALPRTPRPGGGSVAGARPPDSRAGVHSAALFSELP